MKRLAELMDLSERVALVTGACGGIGRVLCDALCELNCTVCLLDFQGDALMSQARELDSLYRGKIGWLNIDLEMESQRSEVPDKIRKQFGRLDILVNNAALVGASELTGWAVPFEKQELGSWRRGLEVNLTACFHLSQLVAPLLRDSGKGSIVNVGSIYGVVGPDLNLYSGTEMGSPAAYAAAKGGLIQLTRWMATVLAPHIRVNCFSPGGIFRHQPEGFVSKYTARTPLARMATEEDCKGAIAYLASDLSAYVTGQNIMIDGGWTSW